MKKLLRPFLFLILLLALVGGVILVKQRQETRRGAFYAAAKSWFLPTEAGDKKTGDLMPVYLVADFEDKKMIGFTIKIVYSQDKLELIADSDVVIHSAFNTVVQKTVDQSSGVVHISAVSTTGGVEGILGPNEPLVKLGFKVKDSGSAEVKIDKSYSHHQVVGDTAEADREIELKNQSGGEDIKVSYNFAESQCQTDSDCNDGNPCTEDTCDDGICSYLSLPDGTVCEDGKGTCQNGVCVASECNVGDKDCGGPNNRPRLCDQDGQWVLQNPCASGYVCQEGECILETQPTDIPTTAPTQTPDALILNFKVTFTGVLDSSKVKESPKVLVKVKKGFQTIAEFAGVELEADEGAAFKGKLTLDGVTSGDGYSIYVKGPRHLSRKFCQDKQAERCFGEGKIALKTGENSFDFSALLLEPGDLPNPSEGMKQDGVVNITDFSLVKGRLGSEELSVADLDFNGAINSRDIVLLLQTLSSKYEEE